jgi:hypothetical protein
MTSSSAGYRQGATDAAYYASSPTSTPPTSTRGARYSDASDMRPGSAGVSLSEGVAATPMVSGISPRGMSGAGGVANGTHGVSSGHMSSGHASAVGMGIGSAISGQHHGGSVLHHEQSEEVCGRKMFTQVRVAKVCEHPSGRLHKCWW